MSNVDIERGWVGVLGWGFRFTVDGVIGVGVGVGLLCTYEKVK